MKFVSDSQRKAVFSKLQGSSKYKQSMSGGGGGAVSAKTREKMKEKMKEGGPEGLGPLEGSKIRWDPSLGHEAQVMSNGDIHVGKKFFQLTPGQREHVVSHEAGHRVFDEALRKSPNYGDAYWKTESSLKNTQKGTWGSYVFGQSSGHEAAAEAMAVRVMNPGDLGRYRGLRQWTDSMFKTAGVSPSKLRGAVKVVGGLKKGSSTGKITIGELK